MNRWKIAFWCCLALLLFVVAVLIYSILDQGVSLTHQKEAFVDTEQDFNQIIEIVNNRDFAKSELEAKLKGHRLYEFMDFQSDTISLERVNLIFENNELKEIKSQW